MSQNLREALRLAKLGFSIIPLREKGKEPAISTWKPNSTSRATSEEITKWFMTFPQNNVGIVTGSISNLVVVDIDGPEGEESAKQLGLFSPVQVFTGKGRHLYYKHPGGAISNSVRKYPGLDVRGDNGYVVAPPSVHPMGGQYKWFNVAATISSMPSFPSSLFVGDVQSTDTLQSSKESIKGNIGTLLASLKEGNRNDTFTRIVGSLHRAKYSAGDIRDLLARQAEAAGFDTDELDRIISSVGRYDNSSPGAGRAEQGSLKIYKPADDWDNVFEQHADEGLRTGYSNLDSLIGGMRKGEVFTVAARTGVGKTNLGLGISSSLCKSGQSVLFFSTEMSVRSIWERYRALQESSQTALGHSFFVCDEFIPNLDSIRKALIENPVDLFIFDHINNVGDESHFLAEFMRGLKEIARDLNIPGLVLAQLNRNADWVDQKTGTKQPPRLSQIKGSGAIEEASAQVMLLQEIRQTPEQTDIIGILDKNRYGDKGVISFALKKTPWRMEEI